MVRPPHGASLPPALPVPTGPIPDRARPPPLAQTTTANGKLLQTLEEREKNDLNYTGASIQSWNKFCFQGGRLEASIRLPGSPTVNGLWPAFWTMGNLGRVGYGGTLEGLWYVLP